MILIFKTNVNDSLELAKLQPVLDKNLKYSKWNFDLEDCDKILRIESNQEVSSIAIKTLHERGYDCEELFD